jgi:hypothetical protein
VTSEQQRQKWRDQKRRQRGSDPQATEKRRAYYLANRERLLERQRTYYREVWKFRVAGVTP